MTDDDREGIESITISSPGHGSATLTPEQLRRAAGNLAGVSDLGSHDRYPVPDDSRFAESGEFLDGDDLEAIGDSLIARHGMSAPDQFTIRYLWKREATKRASGKCIKASGPLRHVTGADFVIWIAADSCRESLFTLRQVEALVYHELLHVGMTDNGDPAVRYHDAEVFRDELRDYGMWNANLEMIFGQLELPIFGGGL